MICAQTPNMPRIQVTICGAPKTTAIPTIAGIGHPQEIRLAIAMIPSTITRMMAIGVAHDLAQTFERVAWLQSVAFH